MKKANSNILNTYWGLLKGLNNSWKEELILRLKASLMRERDQGENLMKAAFGAWESEESADEMISLVRESRSNYRDIESF
ncbi:MAG: hypothetical protein AAFR61_04100 [Bacteroidota bacterium]